MTSFILYIVQSSIVFTGLFCLYKVLFSKSTFHRLNRGILVALPFIALLAPFTYLIAPTSPTPIGQVSIVFNEFVAESSKTISQTLHKTSSKSFSITTLLVYAYILGSIILFVKMVHSVWWVIKLKKQSQTQIQDGYQLVFSPLPQAFSFFNWIFVPQGKSQNSDDLIIAHEKAHIQLKHSIDVFFSELYILLFWFNPLVYTYRKSLKSIHEYQADAWVLQGNVKTSSYLQALLHNIQVQSSSNLYHYFNQSLLKKRIDMITKKPTRTLYKLTYLVFLASVVLISAAFTKPRLVSNLITPTPLPTFSQGVQISATDPPSLFPIKNSGKQDITSYFGKARRHPITHKIHAHHGIDIRAKKGTPIIATADGIVVKASDRKDWGNLIIINHAGNYQTRYAHLQGFNVKVKQSVKKGQIIGYVGNTGLSSGPHLHYELRKNDRPINPLKFITLFN
ncbi:hypothetical protein BKI52_28035 [marine bacterium AO1-C]|nr:hypothetical protein BKI52_28035 [marine bacterium AO1-C]